jgi:hypothetical protein
MINNKWNNIAQEIEKKMQVRYGRERISTPGNSDVVN